MQGCDEQSIITAASQAVALNLSISPALGYAHVIPYNGKATFQIGYKGLIQLAQRSGLYRTINADIVYEGEIKSRDRLSGKIEFGERTGNEVIGYFAHFELLNGFTSTLYMSKEDMENHALKFSTSYKFDKNKNSSVWAKEFDKMATKTVLKLLLNKYGPMSPEMEKAVAADQSVIDAEGNYNYVDNVRNFRRLPDSEKIISVGTNTETGEKLTADASVPPMAFGDSDDKGQSSKETVAEPEA